MISLPKLSLRVALAIGFAAVIGLTLVVGVVSLVTQERSFGAVDKLIELDGRIAELSIRSNVAFLKARRAESDFLLYHRESGFDEARSRYVAPLRASLDEVREHMSIVRSLSGDPKVVERARAIKRLVAQYEAGVLRIVDLYGDLGNGGLGAERLRINAEIQEEKAANLTYVHAVEPALERLYASAAQGEAATRSDVGRMAQMSRWAIAVAGLLAVLLGLLVARIVSRHMARANRALQEEIIVRQQAEESVQRLNRVHAVLSGINSLIVRVRDREELFREACRIAVDAGHFSLAWIGVVDRDARRIEPAAWAGAFEGYFEMLRPRLSLEDDAPGVRAAGAQAIMEKKAVVINDVESDPRALRKRELLERNIRSLAILPLLVSGEAVGLLALHAPEAGFFSDEEMKLLLELSGDISFALDHIEKEEKLDYLAYYDALTGLANRSLFLDRLAHDIRSASRDGHWVAVFIVDLERFKAINDGLGRHAGDALLQQVAQWLTRNVADSSLVARVGADQFAIMLPHVQQDGNVARLIDKRLRLFLDHPFQVEGTEVRVAAKVGVALYPDDGADAEGLLQNAEAALKKAKAGGERYLFYTQRMTAMVAGNLTLENELRRALKKEEFTLHYQPKVDARSGRIDGVEALIRWRHPERGLVPPMQFIPILEETGMILEVGAWAMARAVQDHRAWVEQGIRAPRIAVNVSPIQLRKWGFVAVVKEIIGRGVQPTGLDLEITESLAMEDIQGNIEKLQAIRELGVEIAIDDFGTGYSSLGYLARLPVQTLKIDRSFIITMLSEPNAMTLVRTMITLAHSLHLKVVAEGVDSEDQAKMLRLLGCEEMQGYLFSKPLPFEAMTALLQPRTEQRTPALEVTAK